MDSRPSYDELATQLAAAHQAAQAAEAALRESEARARQMFEHNRAVKLIIDPESGAIVEANPAACTFYGYPHAVLTALKITDINTLSPGEVAAELERAATEQRRYFRFRHRLAAGEIRDVEVHTGPITLGGRRLLYSIIHDITEQVRAQAALRAGEEQYRLLFAANPQAMWIYDCATLRFLEVNEAALTRYGYTRAEFLAMTILDIRPPEEVRMLRQYITTTPDEALVASIWRHRLKDGSLRWVDIISYPLTFDGRAARLVLSTDITERQRAEEALRESEERYRDLVENANDIIYTHDLQGNFTSINAAGLKLYGYRAEEMAGVNLRQVVDPTHLAATYARIHEKVTTSRRSEPYELLTRARDGRPVWVEVNSRLMHDNGRPVGVQSIARDITERKQAETQLRLQAAALESATHAILITDCAGTITWVNPAFTRLTGYSAADALGQNTRLLKSGEQDAPFYENLWQTILAGQVWHGELVNQRKDGSRYIEEQTITPVVNELGEITHFISIQQDITERKHSEQQLSYLASHDPLTGLPNRNALEADLERVVVRARRGQASALLFLDLDNFKLVNDTMGHTAGDQVLVTLTQVLAHHLREGDLLARLGGDEFAVLLEGTDLAYARLIAERMLEAVDAHHFTLEGRSFDLGLSIGLVPIDGQQSAPGLLAQAEIAMYTAKEQGRNRAVLYHPAEDSLTQLSEAHQWIRRIKDALREDRLLLHFQPVARLSDARIEHYEALIRMRGELGEIIPPSTFIPAAERFGLMPALDRWIVRQVIQTLHDHAETYLFMNLSGHSLADEALLHFIETELHRQDVRPERLGFEITETAAVQDLVRAERWIRQIKALGCRFALDDFGVGFTSFAYLRSLPVDQIKIDGSFIRTLDEDPSNRHIVQAMHTLARSLGKETVAEFVESDAVLQILREIGVTYGQGYYQGRAMSELPRTNHRETVAPLL